MLVIVVVDQQSVATAAVMGHAPHGVFTTGRQAVVMRTARFVAVALFAAAIVVTCFLQYIVEGQTSTRAIVVLIVSSIVIGIVLSPVGNAYHFGLFLLFLLRLRCGWILVLAVAVVVDLDVAVANVGAVGIGVGAGDDCVVAVGIVGIIARMRLSSRHDGSLGTLGIDLRIGKETRALCDGSKI